MPDEKNDQRVRAGVGHFDKLIVGEGGVQFDGDGQITTSGGGSVRMQPEGDGKVYVRDAEIPHSGLDMEDEGVPQGNAGIMDVVGAGASIGVVGGKATLNVGGAAGILEVQKDTVKVGDASILNYAGTGVQVGVATGIATIDFPEVSEELISVHPDYTDDPVFAQYSTVEAAITRAKAIRGVGKFILIRVQAAIYQPTVQWDLHDGYGLIFDPGALFDFSSWVGGTTFIQLAGFTYLKSLPATFGASGAHPFTGGKLLEGLRVDPVTAMVTQAVLQGVWIWDYQGGATYGIHLTPGGGALGSQPVMFFADSSCNVTSSVGSVVVEGDWNFSAAGTSTITCIFASALKMVDSGTDYPLANLDITRLRTLGGVGALDFEKSPNSAQSFNGSVIELARTNMDWFNDIAGLAEGPISQENIMQYENPRRAPATATNKYSLQAGFKEINNRLRNHADSLYTYDPEVEDDLKPFNGENLGIYNATGSAYVSTNRKAYQAQRSTMAAGALVYFRRMNSLNGIPVDRQGFLYSIVFTNDNVLTRDLKIWKLEPGGPTLTLLQTISLTGVRFIRWEDTMGSLDSFGQQTQIIAALDAGTGIASNALITFEMLGNVND